MADLCQIFKDALHAEGMTNIEVQHTQNNFSDVFQVKKEMGNKEPLYYQESITFQEQESWGDHVNQQIACVAASVAQEFDSVVTERHEWGENAVDIDREEDTALCLRCGTHVSLDDLRSGSVRMAETTMPQPMTSDYSDLPKYKKQFALLALLRDECEPYCSNSPTERFKYL